MASAYGGPGKYIQRAGEISRLATHVAPLGRRVLVVIDGFLHDSLAPVVKQSLEDAGLLATTTRFGGECCMSEIERISELARQADSDVLVGVGGGKTIDATKLAATSVNARVVIAPTIASTDAPCSAVTVCYTVEGVYEKSISLPRNPDLVVVDTEIIIKAPVRYLVAGIGDALSTWFEARSNLESRTNNYIGGGFPPTAAGVAIARTCHEVLMRDGLQAKIAAERGLCTTAVENIIEANTLLSSIGFENCGCSAAHGIHNGLTALDETHGLLHGEKVAFGVLCLLMLENRERSEIEAMIRFCRSVGLPTTLANLGIKENLHSAMEIVAQRALAEGEVTFAVPVELSVPIVKDAILALDAFATQLPA